MHACGPSDADSSDGPPPTHSCMQTGSGGPPPPSCMRHACPMTAPFTHMQAAGPGGPPSLTHARRQLQILRWPSPPPHAMPHMALLPCNPDGRLSPPSPPHTHAPFGPSPLPLISTWSFSERTLYSPPTPSHCSVFFTQSITPAGGA